MIDPVMATLILRGFIATLFVIVGAWCVYLGSKLLFEKRQSKSENSFEASIGDHKISFSAGTAGTAVVFASAVWVVGAVITVPSLELAGGTTVAFGPEVTNSTGIERVAAYKFKKDRKSLTAYQKRSLSLFVAKFDANSAQSKFIIEGYADVGATDLNSAIANQRVIAVKQYLVKHQKIDPSSIKTVSYGSIKPVLESNRNAVILTATKKNN